jgi:hypothetical protein
MTSQDPSDPDPVTPPPDLSPSGAMVSEPAPEAAEPVSAPAKSRNGAGFAGALLGGAVALTAGFGLSHYDLLGLRPALDDSALRAVEARAGKLEQDLATAAGDNQRRLDALAAQIAEGAAPDPALGQQIGALTDRLAKLEAEMAGLSSLPADGTLTPAQLATLAASVEALRGQVGALKAGLDATAVRGIVAEALAAWEADAAEKLRAETTQAEAAAARAAALAQLTQAAGTGAPYAQALPALGADLPAIVTKYAETGLPPLSTGFADAARRALDAALRAAPGAGMGERFLSFLRIQTGARSLTPQDGDDPDAILSRAEAAVGQGDAQKALDEVAALPPEAQAELAEWRALAQDHLDFAAALQALSEEKP